MFGAVGTSEIGLIVSGLAAVASITAVVITYRLGIRRFEHERRLVDLDAVRLVIDDAAASLQTAHSKMAVIRRHLGNYAQRAEGKIFPLVREHRFQLEKAHDDLAAQEGRLEIRFGSGHELANIYREIGSAVLQVVYEADQIEQAPAIAAEARRGLIDRAILEVGQGRQAFILTAWQVVGVRLPAKRQAET